MPKKKTTPQPDRVVIEIPMEDHTPETIDNLRKMVQAKEALIMKALGATALPIQVLDDRIAFPWLETADVEMVDACAQFISRLAATAKTKKRVQAETKAVDNEKFRFRIFCVSLGMVGPEFAQTRRTLGRRLDGNSAWASGVDPRKKAAEAPVEAE